MHWFSDDRYSEIEQEIVVTCVDTVVSDGLGRILLGKREKGPVIGWWIFGGRMSVGESYRDASTRHLKQELGIDTFKWKGVVGHYLLHYSDYNGYKRSDMLIAPLVEIDSKSLDIKYLDSAGHTDIGWFGFDDIKNVDPHSYLVSVVNDSRVFGVDKL